MHRGYTKRWRKRWDKGYHRDSLLWILMDYFIDFATYKDKEVFKKGVGKIPLKRGQWHFTYRELAKFMAVNPRRIRTCISMLTKLGFLTLRPTHQYTIATVNKYDTYQPLDLLIDTPTDTDPTQGRHRVDTPLIITKKVNKGNKDKIPFVEIVSYLNAEAEKDFRATTKETQRAIRARWNEGFRFPDFKRVIATKCAQWKTDSEMMGYLRPQTLFGTKFEAYLNEGEAGDAYRSLRAKYEESGRLVQKESDH